MNQFIKPIMIIIGIVQLLLWGLAPLLSSEMMAGWFGLTHAGEFAHWVRFFGMMGIMWGLLLIAAAFKPRENKLVINFSILLFIFAVALSLVMMYVTNDLNTGEWIWWVSLVLSVVFALALIIWYPREAIPAPEPEPSMPED